MDKKKSNVTCQISQSTYFYKDKSAKKCHYGWKESDSHNGEEKLIDATSVKEYVNYILQLAAERGFTLTRANLTFNKVPSDNIRKEVKFDVDCESNLVELGFEEE